MSATPRDSQGGSAETLREAAALLRAGASEATPGPWMVTPAGVGLRTDAALVAGTALPRLPGDRRHAGDYELHHIVALHDANLPEDHGRELLASLRWAATVHPGLAEPLAAWLEREARVVGKRHPSDSNPAMVVARVILGSADL